MILGGLAVSPRPARARGKALVAHGNLRRGDVCACAGCDGGACMGGWGWMERRAELGTRTRLMFLSVAVLVVELVELVPGKAVKLDDLEHG